jgi:hypothetical protein
VKSGLCLGFPFGCTVSKVSILLIILKNAFSLLLYAPKSGSICLTASFQISTY